MSEQTVEQLTDELRKQIWAKCLLLTAYKKTQYNKGKRAAYEEIWELLGGDMDVAK